MKTYLIALFAFALSVFSGTAFATGEVRQVMYNGHMTSVTMPVSNDILSGKHSELECMALNIYYEARGESQFGKELVAQVTINRYRIKGYDKTICGVVTAKKQFSWTRDGKSDMPQDTVAYIDAMLIAVKFMYMDYHIDVKDYDIITNFHSLDATPKNWNDVTFYFKEGGHRFYKTKRKVVFVYDDYVSSNINGVANGRNLRV